MYKLYSIAGSCSTGIHVLFKKLNIPVEIIFRSDVDDYTAIVPTNQVPALDTGEEIIVEGAAIALYLLNKYGDKLNPEKELAFNQKLLFNYATLHPAYGKIFRMASLLPMNDDRGVVLQALADDISSLWNIVDDHLSTHKYMFGESPSLIDYLLVIYANWGKNFPDLTIEFGVHIKRLLQDVSERTEFIEAFEYEGAAFVMPE